MGRVVRDKSESVLRWLILLLTCLMMIGNYYCYDIPAALHSQMNEYFGKPSDFETYFSLLYTVYSVPNVILPFFGGYFVDKWGSRLCLIIFASFITAGQAITAFGLSLKSWPIMFVGRVVFGIGGESMGVGNSAILSVWFKGKELAFAFGLNLSVARLGSVFNNLISPVLADSIDIQFAMWFGVALCGGSLAAALLISSFDKSMDIIIRKNKGAYGLLESEEGVEEGNEEQEEVSFRKESRGKLNKPLIEDGSAGAAAAPGNIQEDGKPAKRGVSFSDAEGDKGRASSASRGDADGVEEEGVQPGPQFKEVFSLKKVFWILTGICVVVYGCVLPFNNIASALLLERDYFKEPPSECRLQDKNECQSGSNKPQHCPSSKWYQPPLPKDVTVGGDKYHPLEASDIDCTEDDWADDCTKEYCDRQTDAQIQAGTIMSIPYIISACLSPLLGGFADRYGMRAIIATMAPAVLVLVHALLGYTTVSPEGPLVGQGLAYSGFAAVLWPSLPLVVEERLVGLAFGTAFSIQNIGLATIPLIVAAIYSSNGDKYIPKVEGFFVLCAAMGVLIGLYLNYYDYFYMDSILNLPASSAPRKSRAESFSGLMGSSGMAGDAGGKPEGDKTHERVVRAADGEDDDDMGEGHNRASSSEIFSSLR